jgi:hypothetical protein
MHRDQSVKAVFGFRNKTHWLPGVIVGSEFSVQDNNLDTHFCYNTKEMHSEARIERIMAKIRHTREERA